MINKNVMKNFLGTFANEKIGKTKYEKETTVEVEFAEFCKDAGKYICLTTQYYTSCGKQDHSETFLDVVNYEELQERAERKLHYLIKKALWLNCKCKDLTGETFLQRKLDRNSVHDCTKFVQEFYELLQDLAEEALSEAA